MTSCRILADSINPHGVRLTSWLLTYPRMIHAEFMTHRCFSRNAASSRAIPLQKMVDTVDAEPAWPSFWGTEKKGMQPGEQLEEKLLARVQGELIKLLGRALVVVKWANDQGLHKSICNRYIEPWSHITTIATATDHSNFFVLRAHPDAEPTFRELAYKMLRQYISNSPDKKDWGEWHIPNFLPPEGIDVVAPLLTDEQRIKVATARCARLSYLTFDGDFSVDKDITLHDRLMTSGHWSPFEHCACAGAHEMSNFDFCYPSGWQQYRKTFPQECPSRYNLNQLLSIYETKPSWITI